MTFFLLLVTGVLVGVAVGYAAALVGMASEDDEAPGR